MKNKLSIITAALCVSVILFSCKKSDVKDLLPDTTEAMLASRDFAVSENLTADDNQIYLETLNREDISGLRPEGNGPGNLSCATVTVTPESGFPKTIVIDYGTGCTSPNGITRSGIIKIVISDSLRFAGSTSVMTFNNYYINNLKREGTITWTNQNTPTGRGWQRKVENGKITDSLGHYWTFESIRNVSQVAGFSTPRVIFDDAYSITGAGTVTNDRQITRTNTITQALHKAVACDNIDKGEITIVGPLHTSVLNFGNGECDRIATISIDGAAPVTILLR
ncbi:MAG: hypothetical protein ABIP68_05050 [Ferruginibacter sp.]